MAYIQNVKHFENYLAKIIREESITDYFGLSFYVERIFNKGNADQYCWDIRENKYFITRDGVLEWLNRKYEDDAGQLKYIVEHSFTDEFLEYLKELDGAAGVYTFWRGEKILYVGLSTNLRDRIASSFKERFWNIDEQIILKVAKCNSKTDAAILEIYFINKFKPVFNVTAKYEDNMTLTVKPIPKLGKGIVCNIAKQI